MPIGTNDTTEWRTVYTSNPCNEVASEYDRMIEAARRQYAEQQMTTAYEVASRTAAVTSTMRSWEDEPPRPSYRSPARDVFREWNRPSGASIPQQRAEPSIEDIDLKPMSEINIKMIAKREEAFNELY